MSATAAPTAIAKAAAATPPSPQPVSGITVFWVLLGLSLACAVYPLGAGTGFPARTAGTCASCLCRPSWIPYIFVGNAFIFPRGDPPVPLWKSALPVFMWGLSQTAVPPDFRGDDQALAALVTLLGLDIRTRLISNGRVLLLHAKICGYHGVPGSLALASVYFFVWAATELVVLPAYGVFRFRSLREGRELQRDLAMRRDFGSNPPRHLGMELLAGALLRAQIAATIAPGPWITVLRLGGSTSGYFELMVRWSWTSVTPLDRIGEPIALRPRRFKLTQVPPSFDWAPRLSSAQDICSQHNYSTVASKIAFPSFVHRRRFSA